MAEEIRALYLLPPCVPHPPADMQPALHIATSLPLPTKQGKSSYPHCHPQSWARGISILPTLLCLCTAPAFPTASLLPASPVPLPSISLSRKENRVVVGCLEPVQLLPCSEGLSLCHPPKNETSGRFYEICRPWCQYKACGKQTPFCGTQFCKSQLNGEHGKEVRKWISKRKGNSNEA